MDPYRPQYPPYQGQPPPQQGPPPHLRHAPPGHYGPPPIHGMPPQIPPQRPPMMGGMPMYPGQMPPPHHQGYPPHMQQPPPHLQQQQPPPHFQPRPQHPHQPPPGPYGPPPGHPSHHRVLHPGRPGYGSVPPPQLSAPGYAPPPGANIVPGLPSSKPAATPAMASAMVIGGALPDKMNTLFIGSIAPGINNVAMEKLLKTTGNLVRWKRVQDPTSQQWKAFGFAEYSDADSLLRTLRVLGQDGQQPPGEKPVGLELTAMDGSGVVKALLVKADEKTRQFLDQYEDSRPRTILDTEKDKVALANATKIIQQMKDGTLDTTESEPSDEKGEKTKEKSTDGKISEPAKAGDGATEEKDIPDEQKELIARELNFFRERAALKEKEKKEEEERANRMRSNQQHKQQQRDREREKDSNATSVNSGRMGRERAWGAGSRQMDFVPASGANHIEVSSSSLVVGSNAATDADPAVDSEEEEKTRQERRERELEQAYKDHERRWEQREVEKLRIYEKDKARDADYTAEVISMKESMGHRFAQWNDDVERERRHEDYYRDRSRWWQRRQAFLQKEERYDALDREEEKEELEQEAKKAQAQALTAETAAANDIGAGTLDTDVEMKDVSATSGVDSEPVSISSSGAVAATTDGTTPTVEESTPTIPSQPIKLSLALGGLKRPNNSEPGSGTGTPTLGTTSSTLISGTGSGFLAAIGFEGDEDTEKEVKKRRILVPLEYNESEQENGSRESNATKEWKEEQIKALIQSIPAEAQGLWAWPIQWQYVAEDDGLILREKIKPFAAKKVVELLGVEEDELTQFVVEHIRQRKPPQELVDELRNALDNDADVLVMKVWRMLIFETESKARKLASK